MPLPIREQIISAVFDLIDDAVTAPVYRSRSAALTSTQLPAVIVSPMRDNPSDKATLSWQPWELEIMVEIFVDAEPQDQAAAPIIQLIHSAIMAEPRTLGLAAVTDIKPQQADFMVGGDGRIVPVNRFFYAISYRTSHSDLSVLP